MSIGAELLSVLEGEATKAFLVFLRLAAFFALLPVFGEQSIPARVKLALALAMTVVVAPAAPPPSGSTEPILWIFVEILIGVILGLGLRMFVFALQTAGVIAAQSTSLSQLLGGNAVDPLPAMGHILLISGLALAVVLGLHIKATQFFVLSYTLFPIGVFPTAASVGAWGVDQVAAAFTLAFGLAAPFVILSIVYNLALGAINRAMPQLMVAFVGAPLITAGGLVLLLLSSPFMLAAWIQAMDAFLADPMNGR